MYDFIDLTEATTGQPIAVRPMEIKMLCENPVGTQMTAAGYNVLVKESIAQIKELSKNKL